MALHVAPIQSRSIQQPGSFYLNSLALRDHLGHPRASHRETSEVPDLSAELIPQPRELLHRRRLPWNADSFLLQWRGQRLVFKDFGPQGGFLRKIWGSFVIRREVRALSQANGVEGVPRLVGTVGSSAMVRTFLPGRRLGTRAGKNVEPGYFEQLSAVLGALHQRGIAHGDLSRRNVLIDESGRPGLLDFDCAVMSRPECGWLRRWMFRIHSQGDEYQLARMKTVFAPQLLTPRERELTRRPSLLLRLVLTWRDRWQL